MEGESNRWRSPFVYFNLFVHQTTSTDPFRVLISPIVLHAVHSYLAQLWIFLRPINLVKSAPVWCELIELLRFYRFPAHISIGRNVKLMTRFHQDALLRFPWLPFTYVGINDLRMRMYLQHHRCFSLPAIITKTYLYNFDPLKPHFYIVKLGFTGVYIIFLISAQNIDCGYSLEPPQRGGSDEYPQSMFWAEIWKISEFFIWKSSFFGAEIFSIFE